MPPVITRKPIRRSSIKNCYKPNYVKEHQEFVALDNYIRLQGDNFEGKLLCGGSALVKWRISTRNEKQVLTTSDYYELRQIEKRYKKEKFNFIGYSPSHITTICKQLHKGKPVSHIPCRLEMVNPHYVYIKPRNNINNIRVKHNLTERHNHNRSNTHTNHTHNKTSSGFYVTQGAHGKHTSRNERVLSSDYGYMSYDNHSNNNNHINCDNTKSIELNIQSDSEEEKKDTKYPILFKQKIISQLKNNYNFYSVPMKPYLQRYHMKSKYLQTEVFKPVSSCSGITNSNKKIFKSTYITRIKQHANEQRNQLLLKSFIP